VGCLSEGRAERSCDRKKDKTLLALRSPKIFGRLSDRLMRHRRRPLEIDPLAHLGRPPIRIAAKTCRTTWGTGAVVPLVDRRKNGPPF